MKTQPEKAWEKADRTIDRWQQLTTDISLGFNQKKLLQFVIRDLILDERRNHRRNVRRGGVS